MEDKFKFKVNPEYLMKFADMLDDEIMNLEYIADLDDGETYVITYVYNGEEEFEYRTLSDVKNYIDTGAWLIIGSENNISS